MLENKVGNCCICGKETKLYCKSCADPIGEYEPNYYCDEHYQTVVMTGNCCSGNEKLYGEE